MSHVIKPWVRSTRKRTVSTASTRLRAMAADKVYSAGNSYLGLLRQASHSHYHRTRVAHVLLGRGHAINQPLTKIYQRTTS